MERCIIEGKVEGKRRGRPLTSWASDIVELVRMQKFDKFCLENANSWHF